MDWQEGQDRVGSERDVGDRCLLIGGLFPQLAERRNVQAVYYAAMGQTTCSQVAAATRVGYAEFFAQLARAFDVMLRALGALSPRLSLKGGPGPDLAHSWEDEFAGLIAGPCPLTWIRARTIIP